MKKCNGYENFKKALFWVPVLLFLGCANIGEVLRSELSQPSEKQYNFRKTRWGYTQERVILAEQGKRLHLRKGNTLIFKHSLNDIPIKIVYAFKENRLRAAGYVTDQPVQRADKIVALSVEELGEPTQILNDGMLWLDAKTLIYSNAYASRTTVRSRGSDYTFSGGILSHILEPRETPGVIKRWDGVWAYIDQDFYKEMHEVNFPLDEMSYYEKILFGVLKRRSIYTYYSGTGRFSIPR